MATIQSNIYNDLYTNSYSYAKVSYNNTTVPSTETYRGTIPVPAGLIQKGSADYPIIHAHDVQIGNIEADRLDDKLSNYDIILRELYGTTPATLEAMTDGRTSAQKTTLAADNGVVGADGLTGIQSLARVAQILNNRTETVDDRLLDLRAVKTISFGAESSVTTNPSGNKDSIIADNNGDTITISPSNKWVKIYSDNISDSFTIGHLVQSITDNIGTTDFNTANVTTTFDVDTFTFDEAGHVRSRHKHTYTMPQNFKQISVGTQSSAVTNDVSYATGDCIADNLTDTLTLYTGNKWINIAANRAGTNANADDCITFSHILSALTAGQHQLAYSLTDSTPAFGGTFTVPNPSISFTTDEAGHTTAFSSSTNTITVTIPAPSLTDVIASGSDVITQLSLTASTGALSTTRTNIGALTLTGYSQGQDDGAIEATDTLIEALSKLELQIENESNAKDDAIIELRGQSESSQDLNLVALSGRIDDIEDRTINSKIFDTDIVIDAEDIPLDSESIVTVAETLTELAEDKLDSDDFENFKLMYNALIDQLATDLSWDPLVVDIDAMKFTIESNNNNEEPQEPDPNEPQEPEPEPDPGEGD